MFFKVKTGSSNTLALTVDSSQNATFAGGVILSENNAIHFKGATDSDYDAILRDGTNNALLINSRNNVVINIDSNADSTNAQFSITKDVNNTGNIASSLFKVEEDGNATFAGTVTCTSLTETSDIALKTNIEPITNVLDKINQITGYKYDFTKSNSSSMGVIAQDVEKVFPELVHGEEGSKSLQYSGLIGALIESVKELSAKVAALESS